MKDLASGHYLCGISLFCLEEDTDVRTITTFAVSDEGTNEIREIEQMPASAILGFACAMVIHAYKRCPPEEYAKLKMLANNVAAYNKDQGTPPGHA